MNGIVNELTRKFGVVIMTPKDILIQLLEECGYKAEQRNNWSTPARQGWTRMVAADRRTINYPLAFTVAIKDDGQVWLSKGRSERFVDANLYDPGSIELLKEELIAVREEHEAYQRQRQAQ